MMHTLMAAEGGFGLNLNPFETNIINLAIVIAGLVWFLRGFLGGILQRRRDAILVELQEAEDRLREATASLESARQGVAEAQQRAERIRVEGRARADAIRLASEQRTIEELARMKQESASDLDNEAARVRDLLRRETARSAIEKALASLPAKLDDASQARLIDQSIQSLGKG